MDGVQTKSSRSLFHHELQVSIPDIEGKQVHFIEEVEKCANQYLLSR